MECQMILPFAADSVVGLISQLFYSIGVKHQILFWHDTDLRALDGCVL